ncbi:MAG: Uma2 family endonuclease [Jiangellaceae bacterium]
MSAAPVHDPPPWSTIPRGRPFEHADLEAMPDDGRRYEIIDGVLIVTPGPSMRHQDRCFNLATLLRTARPSREWKVLFAPFDVRLADSTVEPDVLVARASEFTEKDLPSAPALAVEILSPSTQRLDLTLKRARYEAAGTPAYWVVDPDPDNPSLQAWELRDAIYVEVAHVHADEPFSTDVPYPISFTPADLVRDPDFD